MQNCSSTARPGALALQVQTELSYLARTYEKDDSLCDCVVGGLTNGGQFVIIMNERGDVHRSGFLCGENLLLCY